PHVFCGHPVEVVMHTFDESVGARDDEPGRVGDDRRVVAAGTRGKVWLDAFEQAKLAEAIDRHGVSMACRRRTACSGSAASATARLTRPRRTPRASGPRCTPSAPLSSAMST